jgi:two-component system, LytTR family, response regulator
MLAELAQIDPDVVFLDIEMNGMNGLELCSKVIEICNDVKVVFVTAYSEYAVSAFELNAIDYLLKPVTQERLLNTLKRLKTPVIAEEAPKSLYFRCLRRFSILLEGKELKLKWRTSKALELIAYLVYEKGIYISKEKIVEALWPELPGESGISKLYLSYYYIKKQEALTGITFPIESERGKMRIILDDVGCDLIEFEDMLSKCRVLDDNNISLAEQAEKLYIGGLFEDNFYEWSTIAARQMEVAYEELLKKIIDYYKSISNEDKVKQHTLKIESLYN